MEHTHERRWPTKADFDREIASRLGVIGEECGFARNLDGVDEAVILQTIIREAEDSLARLLDARMAAGCYVEAFDAPHAEVKW